MQLYFARSADTAVVVSGGTEAQARRIANAHFHNKGKGDAEQIVEIGEIPEKARVVASSLVPVAA